MKTVLKIGLGIALGGIILVVGCSALFAAGIDEAENEATEGGISLREFRAVEQGARQRAVERRLGQPDDAQEFEQEIPELDTGPQRSSCIYYPERDKPLFEGASFQLCFDNGKLTSKNIY